MIYSKLYLKTKKTIPNLIGLFIVLIILIGFLSIFKQSKKFVLSSSNRILQAEVVNLSPGQVTLFWRTNNKVKSWIIYGDDQNQLNQIVNDERDLLDKKGEYYEHYVVLRELKYGTKYFYSIVIDDNKKIDRLIRPDGQLFQFKTPLPAVVSHKISPASGIVLKSNQQPLINGFVILTINDSYPLFTTTKSKGDWLIPLNMIYDINNQSLKLLTEKERVKIEIYSEEDRVKSTIISNLLSISPMSNSVIFGLDYDFINDDNSRLSSSNQANTNPEKKVDIIYPSEGAIIPGRRPIIKGLGIPGKEVNITIIDKNEINAKIKVNANGIWQYQLFDNLALGQQMLKISTIDNNNKPIILSRNFKIIDNQAIVGKVLGEATGASDIVNEISPTPKIIAQTTSIVEPTIVEQVSPEPMVTIPSLGIPSLTSVITGLSLLIIGVGIILIF